MDIQDVNLLLHFALVSSVLSITGTVLIAGLYEIIQNKTQGLQRQDEIAVKTSTVANTN